MMRLLCGLCMVLALVAACSEAPASDPVARGRQVYRALGCANCHTVAGEGGALGPELSSIASVAGSRVVRMTADEYLRESVESPGSYIVPGYNDVMPRGLTRDLSPADLDALIAYLTSLR